MKDGGEHMEYKFIGLIVALFCILYSAIARVQNNVRRIDIKLDRMARHSGLPKPSIDLLDDELKEELQRLVAEGNRVQAIKRLRDTTGMDLREAKDFIDSLVEKL